MTVSSFVIHQNTVNVFLFFMSSRFLRMADDANKVLSPWQPMTAPIDLKHLGKLGEELNEAGAAVSRCIVQGIDQCEPVTGKPNREWLEDELADVRAGDALAVEHFGLDEARIAARAEAKKARLRTWHTMLGEK